jgi:xanthine dehydrogenase YagR molybdenum-binding subunit
MPQTAKAIGRPINRVDGRVKVTGQARYAADAQVAGVLHGVLVLSAIAKGKLLDIDVTTAQKAPGVRAVLTHLNAGKLSSQEPEERPGVDPEVGEPLPPLQDDLIRYHGQPIAAVVADTFEQATHAASLVRVSYHEASPITDFAAAAADASPPTKPDGKGATPDDRRGDPDAAYDRAEVRFEGSYTIAANHHNPMEPHATIAVWEGAKLTLYDKTQWVDNVQQQVALAFDMSPENVRVISPFVGGAFGVALRVWPHTLIAALAARHVGSPVKIVLTRSQMFTVAGYRPYTVQKISLGATADGKLTAIRHDGTAQTSTYEEYTENLLDTTRILYACPNVVTRYRLVPMNVNTPTPMRGPGEASGVYALESAMDELAVALQLDPLELRLRNHADENPENGQPWSSKSLKQCYREGAERFGWHRRPAKPRSLHDGRWFIGYGMASATWPTMRLGATVNVRILPEGVAVVRTATSDIGPGTYTAMTQIAADALGLPVANVRFELGDSALPQAPVQGGSMTVASVGSAVHEAAHAARAKVLDLARQDARSPLHKLAADKIATESGRLYSKDDGVRSETYADLLGRHGEPVEVTHQSKPGSAQKRFAMRAFGAHFVEVRVDADLGTLRVARVVSAIAAGQIINPKTARSQAIGGIVGGIGMALLERTEWDARNGRVVNSNLTDYHVPVNADIPEIDAFFIDEHDAHVNPLGAKGLAELALVGVAAAVANGVYHATGKRVRDLPITLDKLL